jgi:hypothetical protein
MRDLEVGKPCRPDATPAQADAEYARRWGERALVEGAEYAFRRGEHELIVRLGSITRRELDDVGQGECEFALVVENDVLFFLHRFGRSMSWSDAPFSWWLVPEAERMPAPAPQAAEPSVLLQVALVDAGTDIVRALRRVFLSPAFGRALHAAIRVQASRPWAGRDAFDRQIAAAHERCPESRSMLSAAFARMRSDGQ